MALLRCRTCLGVYRSIQADGSEYQHACPPIPNPAFQPLPSLPGFDPRTDIPRPGHRDERYRPRKDDEPIRRIAEPPGFDVLGP